jgi:hypothetical protein
MGRPNAMTWIVARTVIVSALCLFPTAGVRAQGIPPEDAHCVEELSQGIGEFTSEGLDQLLAERIATGGTEPVDLDPALGDELRERIVDNCTSIPDISDSGVCGGETSVANWADCVVESQEVALFVLVDALLGPAPTPTPTPTTQPSPTPTTPVNPPLRCAGRLEPCSGPGISGCCRNFECRFAGSSEPVCVPVILPPPPPSASGAFLDGEEARAF